MARILRSAPSPIVLARYSFSIENVNAASNATRQRHEQLFSKHINTIPLVSIFLAFQHCYQRCITCDFRWIELLFFFCLLETQFFLASHETYRVIDEETLCDGRIDDRGAGCEATQSAHRHAPPDARCVSRITPADSSSSPRVRPRVLKVRKTPEK